MAEEEGDVSGGVLQVLRRAPCGGEPRPREKAPDDDDDVIMRAAWVWQRQRGTMLHDDDDEVFVVESCLLLQPRRRGNGPWMDRFVSVGTGMDKTKVKQ
ncbi:hypothetical protein E2562_030620 [Oryza meyeriana var. granulata]|uniref:Uncharacterized protein n=1 Tax=Oryza meyeriana var. granulata TaxID=110450 RepID=A0A6G1CJI4_9ORYZ|nr:hypothetical protein E2562_030620 [Oryza meyeriana var. granulata]